MPPPEWSLGSEESTHGRGQGEAATVEAGEPHTLMLTCGAGACEVNSKARAFGKSTLQCFRAE